MIRKVMINRLKCLILSGCFWLAAPVAGLAQNPWANPSYNLHDLVLYSGAGAASRFADQNYFGGKYTQYLKSPFLSLGVDYCFANANALWGVGLYCSTSAGKKQYQISSAETAKYWTNSLAVVKFTHHSKYFVRRKVDFCSGYLIGARIKSYEKIYVNETEHTNQVRPSVSLAAGVSFMVKYYPTDTWSLYAEGALGYQVDLFQVGIAKRITFLGRHRS